MIPEEEKRENTRKHQLEEYKICHDYVKHLDSNIYKSAGILGIGSIISLMVTNINSIALLTLLCIAILISSCAWIWWKSASRWWDIQHAVIQRMKDIEHEIGFYRNRYIEFLDNNEEERKKNRIILDGLNEARIDNLVEYDINFSKGKVRGNYIWLPFLITTIWIVILFGKLCSQNDYLIKKISVNRNNNNTISMIIITAGLLVIVIMIAYICEYHINSKKK
jgi:hypothetical protein